MGACRPGAAPSATRQPRPWLRAFALRGLLGLCPFACLVPDAGAEVTESIAYETYVAEPRGEASLLSALNRASPIREGGRIFHGYTRWYIDWRFWWQEGAAGCAITTVKTSVKVGVTLPELRSSDAALSRQFATYLRALRHHEQGHVAIAQSAARDIDSALRRLPPMASCRLLEMTANELGQGRLDAARAEEQRYDRDTGNGRTQGAWLER